MRSPKGREIQVRLWGSMPYITKDELNQLIMDLPDHQEKGRTGKPAQAPKAARVARVSTESLDHLRGHIPKEDLARIKSKYRNLPDLYWEDDKAAVITPQKLDNMKITRPPTQLSTEVTLMWEPGSCAPGREHSQPEHAPRG